MPVIKLEFLLYLLPISILLGTNFPIFSIGNRIVYIGTNEILLAILALGSFLRVMLREEYLLISRKILHSIFIFSFVLIISILVTILRTQRVNYINSYIELARWIEYLLEFIIICILVKEERQIKIILVILLLCTIAIIISSLYQIVTFDYNMQRIYGLFISGSNRAGQSVSNPNVLGAFFMISGLYLISFAIGKSFKFRKMLWLLIILNVAVLLQTLSRSAMLGFLVGILVLSFFYRKPSLIVITAGLSSFLLLLSERVQQRLVESLYLYGGSVAARSIISRLQSWKELIGQLPNHLFLGIGFGVVHSKIFTPDNYYLEILLTTGILGFCALIFMLWQIIKKNISLKTSDNMFFRDLKISYTASILAFLIANIFGGLFFNPRLLALFWLLTGLTLKSNYFNRSKHESTSS